MKISLHPQARVSGRQIERLTIVMGVGILIGGGLPMVLRLKERGIPTDKALLGGFLASFMMFVVIMLVFFAFAYVAVWFTRFRIGDSVRVTGGVHAGANGKVNRLLPGGRGVRIELQLEGKTELVDFADWQIKKLK